MTGNWQAQSRGLSKAQREASRAVSNAGMARRPQPQAFTPAVAEPLLGLLARVPAGLWLGPLPGPHPLLLACKRRGSRTASGLLLVTSVNRQQYPPKQPRHAQQMSDGQDCAMRQLCYSRSFPALGRVHLLPAHLHHHPCHHHLEQWTGLPPGDQMCGLPTSRATQKVSISALRLLHNASKRSGPRQLQKTLMDSMVEEGGCLGGEGVLADGERRLVGWLERRVGSRLQLQSSAFGLHNARTVAAHAQTRARGSLTDGLVGGWICCADSAWAAQPLLAD
jgi:hypothetical protein